MAEAMQETECCPRFNPAPWDNRTFEWAGRKFIKDKVFTLFYMPMNFGAVIKRMMAKVQAAGASTSDNMGLSDHTSKWNMDLYVGVDREIPDAQNATISGKFFSKVYEGNFKETGKWCQDFQAAAKAQGYEVAKLYMWYTTCPRCAKKYGKNYVVIIGKLA